MARGKLRIYLGAAPGVGKTYAMLNEGWRAHSRGKDVVVGFVETYDRPNTRAQIRDLEVFPRAKLEYRGQVFEEVLDPPDADLHRSAFTNHLCPAAAPLDQIIELGDRLSNHFNHLRVLRHHRRALSGGYFVKAGDVHMTGHQGGRGAQDGRPQPGRQLEENHQQRSDDCDCPTQQQGAAMVLREAANRNQNKAQHFHSSVCIARTGATRVATKAGYSVEIELIPRTISSAAIRFPGVSHGCRRGPEKKK